MLVNERRDHPSTTGDPAELQWLAIDYHTEGLLEKARPQHLGDVDAGISPQNPTVVANLDIDGGRVELAELDSAIRGPDLDLEHGQQATLALAKCPVPRRGRFGKAVRAHARR